MRRIRQWILAGCLLAAAYSQAVVKPLDGIAAVVDDDVVLVSELVSRMESVRRQLESNNMELPPKDVLLSQILERLIMETIQLQMGERARIRIDDETLTRAVQSIAQQNGADLEQFKQMLAKDGLSYREFREQIRREMIISRVQRSRVNSRVYISDQEVQDFLNSPVGTQAISDEFRVGHILLTVEERASPEVFAAAEAKAEDLYRQLQEGADFSKLAIANSSGGRALEGGDLGWRKAGELPSLFADRVLKMQVGETAPPIRSASGFHIIKLLDKRGASTQVQNQTLVRHILVKPSEIRSPEETKALIDSIYDRLMAGEDFSELAKEYSEDPGSGLMGGELGWSEPGKFVPKFAEIMQQTPKGGISKPFQTQFGWHILKVEDRRTQDMSDEARRDLALRYLHKRRFDEELQEWLREIRDEAYVEVRI